MQDNRYSPPKSVLEDVRQSETLETCPPQVTAAIKLWVASYCFGLLMFAWEWDYYSKLPPVALVVGQLWTLALSGWLFYKIYRGRNWARITWLVLSVVGFVMTLSGPVTSAVDQMPTTGRVQMVLGMGINAITLWLLFFSPARHWFVRAKR